MNTNFELAIVIPCYNEASRLKIKHYKRFLNSYQVLLCFVNDGSSDNTMEELTRIKKQCPSQVYLIDQSQNLGKAEAVRIGVLKCAKEYDLEKIAYLDADLSTSLEECVSISEEISVITHFAFGSRIAKLDTTINRKQYRFLIGRTIATLISKQLKLKIYDTQCGCKVFSRSLAEVLFQDEFISRWLFDVELFHRLILLYGKNQLKYVVKEIPIQFWNDTEDSKVPLSYFFKLWIDLRSIGKAYKNPIEILEVKNEAILE